MSDSERGPGSPRSQFSTDDDEVVWTHGSCSDTDFIVLHHPLLDAHSLPSTVSDVAGHPGLDCDLSSAVDKLSLCDRDSSVDSSSTSVESDSSSVTSSSPESHEGASTPTASYDSASAFITRFMSSPVKGNDAELDLLRALIIELSLRPPNAPDLPCTLTRARKIFKAEVHVNIKEYVATRDKGQTALRGILKPSKDALRRDIRKGNRAPLQWVKEKGLRALLVTCFA